MRLASLLAGSVLLIACSSDPSSTGTSSSSSGSSGTTSSSGGSSSGGSSSGGSSSGGSSSGAAADAGVSNCSTFVDRTADDASRSLQWDINVFTRPERCMKIKVGQIVKFTSDGASTPADFTSHPIGANGGDPGNPITNIDTDTGEVTFASAGTFGFACSNHPAMIGAIQVE